MSALGPPGTAVWRAALDLVGTRFRLQGRDPATGLDCFGVVLAAHAACGVRLAARDDYALRGTPLGAAMTAMDASGLARAVGAPLPGDVALYSLGAGQLHAALLGGEALVHADALLRRVACAPLARLPQPVACWRWNGRD